MLRVEGLGPYRVQGFTGQQRFGGCAIADGRHGHLEPIAVQSNTRGLQDCRQAPSSSPPPEVGKNTTQAESAEAGPQHARENRVDVQIVQGFDLKIKRRAGVARKGASASKAQKEFGLPVSVEPVKS